MGRRETLTHRAAKAEWQWSAKRVSRSLHAVLHQTALRMPYEEEDFARGSSEGRETPERIALICARASGMASFTASESSSEHSNDCAPMVIRNASEGTTL